MTPDADSFRALARSSPWRWRTLHLRARSDGWGEVEAHIARPDRIVWRHEGEVRADTHPRRGRDPADVTPALRPDGLVAERPSSWQVDYDDPMWSSYLWVALLDPEELSHHVAVDRPRAELRDGREVWRADLRPEPGYEPRCGGNCCELLWSEISWATDFPEGEAPPIPPGTVFPDHYDVALDVQTGIVVRCAAVGTDTPWLAVEVLAVDGPAPAWVDRA